VRVPRLYACLSGPGRSELTNAVCSPGGFLDVEVGERSVESAWQPPGPVAEQCEHGGHEGQSHHEGVHENADAEPEGRETMKTSYSIVACTIAAAASLLRGGNYHHDAATVPAASPTGVEPVEEAA
jgi:hypothetical protein